MGVIKVSNRKAVQCDTLSGWGSNLSPGMSVCQRIIYKNSSARDEQGDNPRAGKGRFDCVLYKL